MSDQNSRTPQQIIHDWWCLECDAKRIPQGRETEVFGILVSTLNEIGYTRNEIERLGRDVCQYGIVKKKMPKWRDRYEILLKRWRDAISLTIGGDSSKDSPVPDAVPLTPLAIKEEGVEDLADSAVLEQEEPVKRSDRIVTYTEEQLRDIKNKFNWD